MEFFGDLSVPVKFVIAVVVALAILGWRILNTAVPARADGAASRSDQCRQRGRSQAAGAGPAR